MNKAMLILTTASMGILGGYGLVGFSSGIDPVTNSLQIVDYEHHEIHEGDHYFYNDYIELDNAATSDFCIETPNNAKWSHMVWQLQAQGLVTFQIYEGASFTFDGGGLTARNSNRNSSNTSNWDQFQVGCTVNSTGTLLSQSQIGDTSSPVRGIPGGGERSKELILKQNTDYLFRITSGVNGNAITYQADWYEHTSEN